MTTRCPEALEAIRKAGFKPEPSARSECPALPHCEYGLCLPEGRKSAGRWTAWREFVARNSIWANASWPLPLMILSCSGRRDAIRKAG